MGEMFAAATVGIGQGIPAVVGVGAPFGCGAWPLALGGRWRWVIAGDAWGVDVAWLSAGEPVVLLGVDAVGFLELTVAGLGGGAGLADVPGSSVSRRRLFPRPELSFKPSPVAFNKI